MKIAIVDYGSGNLRSVQQAVQKVAPQNTEVLLTNKPEVVRLADRVVFPGQGAMPDCIANLNNTGLREAVTESIKQKPFFAVCIGEQMLFDHSQEGDVRGLGVFSGDVVRFPGDMIDENGIRLKVPQMGWNRVKQTMKHPMWEGITDNSWFYFVHSYYALPKDKAIVAGTTFYGLEIAVVVAKDNVFATQFHPEKSAHDGLRLYQNFMNWTP